MDKKYRKGPYLYGKMETWVKKKQLLLFLNKKIVNPNAI